MKRSYFGMMSLHLVENKVVRIRFHVLGNPIIYAAVAFISNSNSKQ